MSSARYCLGIDLGTTNTLCALWVEGEPGPRLLPISQPVSDWTSGGFARREMLPSVVTVRPEGVFVGVAARDSWRRGERNVFASIKRHMGERWSATAAGALWTPQRLSGCILRVVAGEVAALFANPPERVVITVPSSFDSEAREATLGAAALAGFDPLRTRIFDEPAAALLHHLRSVPSAREVTHGALIIVDVGGGTLDVSVLNVGRHEGCTRIDIQGRSRYHDDVAGDDFDLHIAAMLLARFEDERKARVDDARSTALFCGMIAQAEEAKCGLSERYWRIERELGRPPQRADLVELRERITCYHAPDSAEPWSTELTLNDLALALRHFFPFQDRLNWRIDGRFFQPIQECLDSVGEITGQSLAPSEISGAFLAGGSAQLPMVAQAVQTIVGQRPVLVDQPMRAVALGAAWFAGLQVGFSDDPPTLQERLYEGIYLQTVGGGFAELLSPRLPIPVEQRRLPASLFMAQPDRRLEVELFTGKGPDDLEMQPLARRRIDFHRLLPGGHPIDLEISVDENRRIRFRFSTTADGSEAVGSAEVSTAAGWVDAHDLGAALPPVNLPAPILA